MKVVVYMIVLLCQGQGYWFGRVTRQPKEAEQVYSHQFKISNIILQQAFIVEAYSFSKHPLLQNLEKYSKGKKSSPVMVKT